MTNPVAGEYRNRTTGLIVFGVLEITLGGLCLLMVPLMLLSMAMAGGHSGTAPPLRALIPGVGLYALIGTAMIWLGIGSILGRRWARALWVYLSGVGLVVGLMASPFVVYATTDFSRGMAASGQPPLPPAALIFARVVMIGFMLLFYIIIPGALFLFYRSPHVKRTCEVRDPKERWTDRCPLPVLALSLFTAFGAVGLLALLAFGGLFPLFGVFVSGTVGDILIVVVAGIMLYLGWGLYRVRIGAWWCLLAVMLTLATSGAVTFWRADLVALYALMGFDSQFAAATGQFGRMAIFRWMGPISMIPWLVWLLYVRRYFPKMSLASGGTTA